MLINRYIDENGIGHSFGGASGTASAVSTSSGSASANGGAQIVAQIYQAFGGICDFWVTMNPQDQSLITTDITVQQYINFSKDVNNISGTVISTQTFSKTAPYTHLTFSCTPGQLYTFVLSWNQGGLRWYSWYDFTSKQTLSTPIGLAYNSSTGNFTFASTADVKVIEFERQTDNNPYGVSWDARDLFYEVCLTQSEFGKYSQAQNRHLTRFAPGSYSIGVSYNDSTPTGKRSTFYNNILQWCSDFNSIISGSGVSFYVLNNNSSSTINVIVGSHLELWNYIPREHYDYRYFGTWENTDNNGTITSGTVKLCWEDEWRSSYSNFLPIVYEEMTEVMGCGNDNACTRADTMFTDFFYPAKPYSFNSLDTTVIQLLYTRELPVGSAGMNFRIASMINAPKGHYSTGSGSSAAIPSLSPDTAYRARIWCANYIGDTFSNKSSWIYFTTPAALGPAIPSAPVLDSRTDGGLSVYWYPVSGATYYYVRFRNYAGVTGEYYVEAYNNPTQSYWTYSLDPGITYYVSVMAGNNLGESDWSPELTVTTRPKNPTLTLVGVTDNSVTVHVSDIPGNWSYIRLRWMKGFTGVEGYEYIYSMNVNVTFTDFVPDTTYYIQAVTFFEADGLTLDGYGNNLVYATTIKLIPPPWSWTHINTTTGDIYSGNLANGAVFLTTTQEWQNFIVRINDVRKSKGLSTYSFSNIYSGIAMTKALLNEPIYAINDMLTSGNRIPLSDGTLTKNLFAQMRDKLNSLI